MAIKNGAGHGGARPGSGRPPKAARYGGVVTLAEERIVEALPDIVEGLIEAAKKGDVGAARYLLDRIMGRTAAVPKPPAEDRRLPYTEEDARRDRKEADLVQQILGG